MGILEDMGLKTPGKSNQPQFFRTNPYENVKTDPNRDIIDRYLSGNETVTSGGSAATFFDRAAAEAAARQQYNTMRGNVSGVYQKQRDTATGRRDKTNTELSTLYSQLASAYEPLAGQTQARYNTAIQQGQQGSADIVSRAQERINQEAAARAAAFAEMGIAGADAGRLTGANEIAQRGINDVNATTANWSGLLGAQSGAEQGRNRLDYTGAQESGVMAQRDVTDMFNRYLEQLGLVEAQQLADIGNQEAAAIAQILQTPVWSGGSAGRTSVVNNSGIPEDIYEEAMRNALGMGDFDAWKRQYDYERQYPKNASSNSGYTPPRSNYG
jgi:hypothetical protein